MLNVLVNTKWQVYEANVQQYRVLSATVQSFLLTVGAILYSADQMSELLLFVVTVLALAHIYFVWFQIVRARNLIVDYYKFQLENGLSEEEIESLGKKCTEHQYVNDSALRTHVNERYFNNRNLRLWRDTRKKLDIFVPIGYTVIWIIMFYWKQPFPKFW